jgi:hypothetical protein
MFLFFLFVLRFNAAGANSHFFAVNLFALQIYFLRTFGFHFGMADIKRRASAAAAEFAGFSHRFYFLRFS